MPWKRVSVLKSIMKVGADSSSLISWKTYQIGQDCKTKTSPSKKVSYCVSLIVVEQQLFKFPPKTLALLNNPFKIKLAQLLSWSVRYEVKYIGYEKGSAFATYNIVLLELSGDLLSQDSIAYGYTSVFICFLMS